eukprot:5834880-Heterocapsa_arctica.AAC.1
MTSPSAPSRSRRPSPSFAAVTVRIGPKTRRAGRASTSLPRCCTTFRPTLRCALTTRPGTAARRRTTRGTAVRP